MRHLLLGTTLALIGGFAGTASGQNAVAPLTGVPGGDQPVAAACTEIDLLQARDLFDQVPPSLSASARIIYQAAEDYQNDDNDLLCAQKLQELRALARIEVDGPAFVAAREVDLYIPGASPVAVTPGAVASACTPTDLARVSDLISRQAESAQPVLYRHLQTANEFRQDDNFQLCANTLAEIRLAVLGQTGPGPATPGYIVSPYGVPLVASECTETDLARVSDLISQAPPGLEATLRQRLYQARGFQEDDNLQLCAQSLAEIRNILEAADIEAAGLSR